jgi:hypothetical protein
VVVVRQADSAAPVGSVVAQDPPPASPAPPGTAVTLTLSAGFPVPDVAGLPSGEAVARLRDAGMVPALAREPSAAVPAGLVLRQAPVAGARLGVGSEVVVVVSSGPSGPSVPPSTTSPPTTSTTPPTTPPSTTPPAPVGPTQVAVPDVVGRPQAEAEQVLAGAGLVPRVTTSPVAGVAPGTVLRQDPPAGTEVGPAAIVTLVVAAAVPAPAIDRFELTASGSCRAGTMEVAATWSARGAGSAEVVDLATNQVVGRGGADGKAAFPFPCFDATQQPVSSRAYRLVAHASADAAVVSTADRVVTRLP